MRYYLIFILSALSLLLERLWNNFWMLVASILIITSLCLFNIFQLMPQPINIISLALLYSAVIYIAYKSWKSCKLITYSDIKRKIELINNLEHRPLDVVKDRSLNSSPIWKLHLDSAVSKIKTISKSYKPNFTAYKEDKYAIRHIVSIIFIISLIITPTNRWSENISNNLQPKFSLSSPKDIAKNIDIWVQPPKYTNKPALFIKSKMKEAAKDDIITIVEGSEIKARANGYSLAPKIKYLGETHILPNSKENIVSLNAKGRDNLKLSHLYRTIGKWYINVVKDAPPAAEVIKAKVTPLYSTKLTYNISDDFGISQAEAIFKLPNKQKEEAYKFPINVQNTDNEQNYSKDLTSHIWAGEEVELFIRATDTFNQKVESNIIKFKLPVRKFSNKYARKIADYRKTLIASDNPKLRRKIATSLAEIAIRPELYKGRISTFMALSVAVKRIVASNDNEGILDLLWDLALQLEDGGLKTSQQKLYQVLQKLQHSINNKSLSNLEKQQLVAEVQMAIIDYIRSLSEELQERLQKGKTFPNIPQKIAERLENSINVEDILKRLQNMSATNSYEDMQQMAENLKNSIENFDINAFEKMQEQQAAAIANIAELEELLSQQQQLLAKTNLTKKAEDIKSLALAQRILRDKLSTIIKELSKSFSPLSDNFANAHKAMNNSEINLEKGFGISAAIHQEKAIKELQQGSNDISDKMAEALKNSILSFSFMPQGNNYGEKFDPLGREVGIDKIKVPSESDIQETKEILQELRKRANDFRKKPAEIEYLERLIH